MLLFHPENRTRSPRHRRVFARFELARTIVDFLAAVCFIIGSAFYFSPAMTNEGTWLFLIGSILFAVKPTIKLSRELAMQQLTPGDGDEAR